MDIADRIKLVRETNRLNQADFAQCLEVNPSYISRLEKGNATPSKRLLNMMSLVFHVNPEWIVSGSGSMESATDLIREHIADEPALRRYLLRMEFREQQLEQLSYLFAPTYPRIWDMLKLLSEDSSLDFVARLNLLIKEWDQSDVRYRARIEVRMEDMIVDFPAKLSAYQRYIDKRKDDGAVVPFKEIAASEGEASPTRVTLPVIGRAAAGAPKSMISLEGEELRTNGDVAHDIRPGDFIVIADGDSMVDCGIHDGDHCVIHQTPSVENGQIALVAIDDGSTIKRFYKDDDGYRLVPCSVDHAEQHYPPDAPIRVLGKFVKVILPDSER